MAAAAVALNVGVSFSFFFRLPEIGRIRQGLLLLMMFIEVLGGLVNQ